MLKVISAFVLVVSSFGFLSGQANYTMQEAAQLYIDGIVYNDQTALKKLSDYVKPVFSDEEIASGNLVPRPSLEEFAKSETDLYLSAYREKANDPALRDAIYKYFLEEGNAVQASKCKITNVVITDDDRELKTAQINFTCEMVNVDLNVAPDISTDSPTKEIVAMYVTQAQRFQNATKTRTAQLSIDMSGKVLDNGKIVWYLPFPTFINQVINMEMTKSEVK